MIMKTSHLSISLIVASGYTCFETRLGALADNTADTAQNLIDANQVLFDITNKLKFSLPLYKLFSVPSWRKLVKAEDEFYG